MIRPGGFSKTTLSDSNHLPWPILLTAATRKVYSVFSFRSVALYFVVKLSTLDSCVHSLAAMRISRTYFVTSDPPSSSGGSQLMVSVVLVKSDNLIGPLGAPGSPGFLKN